MAGAAIGCSGSFVVEAGGLPGIGIMTSGALTAEMVGWFLRAMAGLAVGCPCHNVIETHFLPIGWSVACCAISVIVGNWFYIRVAGCALRAGSAELPVGMTLLAGYLRMLPQKREEGVLCPWAARWELDAEWAAERCACYDAGRVKIHWDEWHQNLVIGFWNFLPSGNFWLV